jgi:cytosine/adenosine deaminase-related metal-dependent hydrolase
MTTPWSLTARWILPVDSPPLPHGVVVVAGDRIAAVESHRKHADVDLGNAAVLPGLVNAHTHLDLTGLRGRCLPTRDFTRHEGVSEGLGDDLSQDQGAQPLAPTHSFPSWLRGVIAHRRQQTPEQIDAAIKAGIAESVAAGTTLVGDIAAEGMSWPALASAPLRAVVFHELLGLPRARANQAFDRASRWLDTHTSTCTCRPALSPHAPYSVHQWLFEQASSLSKRYNVPLATHLAETFDELLLLAHRGGPFVAFLEELGVWDEEGLARTPEEVVRWCLGASRLLLVHGNFLAPQMALPPNAAVVLCPRTHAAFGHPPHPFRDFLQRGVRVALGTDSLASNPDLDVLAEARFLHLHHPDIPGATLLRMATLSGAEALGWADETGSLTPGKSADLAVVPLPDEDASDPHTLLLASSQPVARTLFRGQWTAPVIS